MRYPKNVFRVDLLCPGCVRKHKNVCVDRYKDIQRINNNADMKVHGSIDVVESATE